MMKIKSYFLTLFMIGLTGLGLIYSNKIIASQGDNNYDPIEQIFDIPITSEPITYILPELGAEESYMVKTLGALKVNDNLTQTNINDVSENLISKNEIIIIWDNEAENRAISVYKFKDGNAIMAIGGGGEGMCRY
ncbi:hypothetical protein HZR84_05450 [Hyphobacterium sp. CCMP332]|nr:hypothetical protein HZR84_05450 [Hyphobacterium sp. CCMP332]